MSARATGVWGVVVLVAALPFLPTSNTFINLLNYIGIFSLAALGLVLLTGVGGLISFGQAAFAGIGAYASAWLCTKMGGSPWAGLVFGMLLTTAVALVLGLLTLRMSGHYLPLATIAWSLALYYLMGNLDQLGKYDGMLGVPSIELAGFSFHDERRMYLLIWTCAILAALGIGRVLDSRPGRIMRALNSDDGGGVVMPEAMGASAFRHKLQMFMVAAWLASLSGWLFVHLQRSVNPTPFGIKYGIEYLLMAVVGGVGSVWGAFVGAALVKVSEDLLQVWLPRLFGAVGAFEIIVFGVVLVLVLAYVPGGLWPLVRRWLPQQLPRGGYEHAGALPTRDKPLTGEVLLEVKCLRKNFGGLTAVNDISFTVRVAEIVGLIGPNGAGKSTTFNLVSGVLPLTSGEVWFNGLRADGLPASDLARRGMSRTFQHVKLVSGLTVLENVAVGTYVRTHAGALAALSGFDRAEERRAMKEAARQLTRVGLGEEMHRIAADLSLGAQRLVEVARALASDPSILLLDEPAAGLRYAEKQALSQVLRQLKGEGLSLLLVEHDMDFLMNLTDHIVVMNYGTLLLAGTPAEIQSSALVRTAYLGEEV